MKKNKSIFIAWISFQRRAISMQSFFDFELYFIQSNNWIRNIKILDYIIKSIKTAFTLFKEKPQIVWIQLPPVPLLIIAIIYKYINPKTKIILDCHNGLFSKKWEKYLLNGTLLNKSDLTILHNRVIKEIAIKKGSDPSKSVILETRPALKKTSRSKASFSNYPPPYVLVPCSFSEDEPVEIILAVAKSLPKINFIITGDLQRLKKSINPHKSPSNVTFTGFLKKEEYEDIFINANVVLGLTTEHHIQLSVANEAVGFGKAMVISDTELLRELFYKGAIYVETLNPISISNGISTALSKSSNLQKEIIDLKEERDKRWILQAELIKSKITSLQKNIL